MDADSTIGNSLKDHIARDLRLEGPGLQSWEPTFVCCLCELPNS
jgi:hypothetical protein